MCIYIEHDTFQILFIHQPILVIFYLFKYKFNYKRDTAGTRIVICLNDFLKNSLQLYFFKTRNIKSPQGIITFKYCNLLNIPDCD